jgi:hypothetical protein
LGQGGFCQVSDRPYKRFRHNCFEAILSAIEIVDIYIIEMGLSQEFFFVSEILHPLAYGTSSPPAR